MKNIKKGRRKDAEREKERMKNLNRKERERKI